MNIEDLYNRIVAAQYAYDGLTNDVVNKSLTIREHVDTMLCVAMNRYNQGDFYNANLFVNVAERIKDE